MLTICVNKHLFPHLRIASLLPYKMTGNRQIKYHSSHAFCSFYIHETSPCFGLLNSYIDHSKITILINTQVSIRLARQMRSTKVNKHSLDEFWQMSVDGAAWDRHFVKFTYGPTRASFRLLLSFLTNGPFPASFLSLNFLKIVMKPMSHRSFSA